MPTLCRDINSQQACSRRQFHVATSWRLTHVATSNPCRDAVSTHSGISRLRHQKPGRDLPHCYPCRDLKMMPRPQLSSAPFLLRRDAIFPCRDISCCHPCRDLKMMSRHQFSLAKIPGRHPETYCNPARSRRHFLVATSRPTKPGRDLKSMLRPQHVLTHNDFFFFIQ